MQFQIPDCFFEAWQHNWCNLGQWRWQPQETTHNLWLQLCPSLWGCGILVKMLLSTWKPQRATSPWPFPANLVPPVPLIPFPPSLPHLLQKWSHTTVALLKGRRIASALPCTRQPRSCRNLLLQQSLLPCLLPLLFQWWILTPLQSLHQWSHHLLLQSPLLHQLWLVLPPSPRLFRSHPLLQLQHLSLDQCLGHRSPLYGLLNNYGKVSKKERQSSHWSVINVNFLVCYCVRCKITGKKSTGFGNVPDVVIVLSINNLLTSMVVVPENGITTVLSIHLCPLM